MVRYTGPKNRIARKFGANIFGKKRNPLAHKVNPPGMHGAKRTKKSDYGIQLEEKQKLRACYGMLPQKTIVRYYKESCNLEGNTQDHFMRKLETRLDTLVYRLKFALTPFHAQQLVSHGHILVNGKKIDIRSYQVQEGSVISIAEKGKNNNLIKEALERSSVSVPEYLSLDGPGMNGKLLVYPHMDQIPLPIPVNVAVVCEFLAYTT